MYHLNGQKKQPEFQDLKQAITGHDVMLFHPEWNAPFELCLDASKLGCGFLLAQEKDGVFCPIRFAFQAFTPAESCWTTMQQELFAVKWGLKMFPSYLLGRRVKVVTDHANLKWLTTMVPQQAKVARWCMSMAKFDFFIEHGKGERNIVPDVLSRHPAKENIPDDNVVIPSENPVTVPPKSKLPPLVSFLARRVSFLLRRFSFLSRHFSFLSRITEAFSMAYITRKKPVMCNDCCSAVHWQIDGGWDRVTEDTRLH